MNGRIPRVCQTAPALHESRHFFREDGAKQHLPFGFWAQHVLKKHRQVIQASQPPGIVEAKVKESQRTKRARKSVEGPGELNRAGYTYRLLSRCHKLIVF